MPKKVKRLIAAVLGVVIVAFIFVSVGKSLADPEKIVKGYFQARVDRNWDKVYSYLALEDSDFINKENFSKVMQAKKQPDILNFEVTEQKYSTTASYYYQSSESSDLVKNYTVKYVSKGYSSADVETVTLVKKAEKKLLFFDDYEIAVNDLIVNDYELYIPSGATVYMDDTQLKEVADNPKYKEEKWDAYKISKIFSGDHVIRVEAAGYEPFTKEIEITSYSGNYYYINLYELTEIS